MEETEKQEKNETSMKGKGVKYKILKNRAEGVEVNG